MEPVKLNLSIYKGATFIRNFEWKTKTSNGVITPVSLANCSIHCQIRPYQESEELIIDLGALGYINIIDAETGKFEINIPANVTKELVDMTGVYDIEILFIDTNIVHRVIEGIVTIIPEVTRVEGLLL